MKKDKKDTIGDMMKEMNDIQLLQVATRKLLERAYRELCAQKPYKNSVFGSSAPINTLHGTCRLLLALMNVSTGKEPPYEMVFCEADQQLLSDMAAHLRLMEEQRQEALRLAGAEYAPDHALTNA